MDFRLSGMDLSGCDPKAARQWTQSLLYNENIIIIVVVVVQSIVSTTNQWTWLNGKKSGGILSLFANSFRCKQFEWIPSLVPFKMHSQSNDDAKRIVEWNGIVSLSVGELWCKFIDDSWTWCCLELVREIVQSRKEAKKIDVKNGNHWEFCFPLVLIVWNLRLLQTTSFEMEPILAPVNILSNCGTLFPWFRSGPVWIEI